MKDERRVQEAEMRT